MRRPTIAAGFARALMDLAVSKGADPKALAERSRIGPADLEDQDNRIPFESFVALMRAGKELCHDPALGLHFGEAYDLSELSIVGLIADACETGAEAFRQLNRYARLAVDVDLGSPDRYRLEQHGDDLWMIDARENPNEFPELTESVFARGICMARRIGETRFFKAIHVTHPEPGYRAEYDRIFQIPVIFGSDENAMVTDGSWLTYQPAPPSSRYVFGILSARAEALLESLESSRTTRGHVESALMPILHTGEASMATVARRLGLSRQTLFRRLKAEGVTFERVLDELRHRLALHYLGGKKVSVNQTAYLVGFSEPAAFSRAFKRWTGSSPRRFMASPREDP